MGEFLKPCKHRVRDFGNLVRCRIFCVRDLFIKQLQLREVFGNSLLHIRIASVQGKQWTVFPLFQGSLEVETGCDQVTEGFKLVRNCLELRPLRLLLAEETFAVVEVLDLYETLVEVLLQLDCNATELSGLGDVSEVSDRVEFFAVLDQRSLEVILFGNQPLTERLSLRVHFSLAVLQRSFNPERPALEPVELFNIIFLEHELVAVDLLALIVLLNEL
jgi:hypothetical protein